jgi:hypothetical protein
MSDSVLLRFLSGGLINVGGDDLKLEKLQAASQGVCMVRRENASEKWVGSGGWSAPMYAACCWSALLLAMM